MKILYCGAHSILEYDDLRLFHSLGHDVFSLGAYITPSEPHEDKRPPLPQLPFFADLKQAVDDLNQPDNLDAAKVRIPDALLDWADTIIFAAYEWRWLAPQWDRIKGKRVIWRTIGQSMEPNERLMAPLFRDGLEIVRYSPKERNIPGFAGESAVIRFAKDPDDWYGWTGEEAVVGNVTQHLLQRGPATGYGFWASATEGLPTLPCGPGSEEIGGTGTLPYDELRAYLRRIRCYLYCGTQPASYTLGLIEAMMTGVPVVSIGPRAFGPGYLPELFEGHEIAQFSADNPEQAKAMLGVLLDPTSGGGLLAPLSVTSETTRRWAIDLFGFDTIAEQWRAYL